MKKQTNDGSNEKISNTVLHTRNKSNDLYSNKKSNDLIFDGNKEM